MKNKIGKKNASISFSVNNKCDSETKEQPVAQAASASMQQQQHLLDKKKKCEMTAMRLN